MWASSDGNGTSGEHVSDTYWDEWRTRDGQVANTHVRREERIRRELLRQHERERHFKAASIKQTPSGTQYAQFCTYNVL
jgi:hypothetical protein